MKSKLYGLLLCVLFVSGCSGLLLRETPPAEQVDRSLFTGVPCAVPCWHGLEVGRSAEDEVISTLQKLDYIDQATVQINRRSSGVEIIANCTSPARECLKFNVADDVLMKIVVGINYEVRADEAIEQLGEPHYLGVSAAEGEMAACEVYMIWRTSGLVLASTFDTNSDEAEKYCDVVRDTGKIPSSFIIAEARLIAGLELVNMLTSGDQLFTFSGTLAGR
jgi:hypothetical protein